MNNCVKLLVLLVLLTLAACSGVSTTNNANSCRFYTTFNLCPATCTWTGSICTEAPSQCSDVTDPVLCSLQTLNGVGCFWAGLYCVQASTCSQTSTGNSCLATSLSGTTCSWLGSGCIYSNQPSNFCSSNLTLATCPTTSCIWNSISSTCISSITQCSQISNQAICNQQAISGSGCYWISQTGSSGACVATDFCYQATSQTSCLATSQLGTRCSWADSLGCYVKTQNFQCSNLTNQLACQVAFASDGSCFWSGTTCTPATQCQQLRSQVVCAGTTLVGKPCLWVTSQSACGS